MTEQDLRELVARWVARLGLERWRVDLVFDPERPAEVGCDANAWRSDHYERAEIFLHPAWRQWEPDFAEATIVHELLHLHLRDVEEAMLPAVAELAHPHAVKVLRDRIEHELEQAIDVLAHRLVALAAETRA
jgi:hypothetical protein